LIDQLNPKDLPWGARKIQEEIGQLPPTALTPPRPHWMMAADFCHQDQINFSRHVFTLVLGAIAKSGVQVVGSFAVAGIVRDLVVPRDAHARAVHPCGTPAKTFSQQDLKLLQPAFRNLKELRLSVYRYLSVDLPAPVRHYEWLSSFAPVWASVERLSLSGINVVGVFRP
jgi:hypothetical protein